MKKSIGAKTLGFPTPVFVVGSYDEQGQPNIMTAAWGGICCSGPPCLTVSLQEPRHTFRGIMKNQAFTVSIPSTLQAKEADFAGSCSGRDVDKFAATGLTPVKSELVNAPYVKEFPVVIECKLIQTVKLGMHTQFIGEIMDVKADEDVLGDNGLPDMEKVQPLVFAPGSQRYYGIGEFVGQAFSIGKRE